MKDLFNAEKNFKLSAGASYLLSGLQSSAFWTHDHRTKTDSNFADCAADNSGALCRAPLLVIISYQCPCYAQAEASWYKQCGYLMSWWASPIDTSSADPAHGTCMYTSLCAESLINTCQRWALLCYLQKKISVLTQSTKKSLIKQGVYVITVAWIALTIAQCMRGCRH